jgi:hypothetical protein
MFKPSGWPKDDGLVALWIVLLTFILVGVGVGGCAVMSVL